MAKCKLCLKKEANQLGSHITSAFLLSSQIGKRGEEKGFTISTDPNQNYGQDVGAEDIKDDYILCSDCEKRLSRIESIYSSAITQKIEKKEFAPNFEKKDWDNGNYSLYSKKLDIIVFHLLHQSIIWRASISTQPLYNHFKLTPELEERMRFNLDLYLPHFCNSQAVQTEKDWSKMTNDCNDLFDFIPIAVIKAENINNKEMTYDFFDNLSKEPYHSIINEYFIFVFADGLVWKDNYFGMKSEFILDNIINKDYSAPVIGVISNEKYFNIIQKINDEMVAQLIQNTRIQCLLELEQSGVPILNEVLEERVMQKIEAQGKGLPE